MILTLCSALAPPLPRPQVLRPAPPKSPQLPQEEVWALEQPPSQEEAEVIHLVLDVFSTWIPCMLQMLVNDHY